MLLILYLFRIGIGPSRPHTAGPLRIARRFFASLSEARKLSDLRRIGIEMEGSLVLTGAGLSHPYATTQLNSLIPETCKALATGFSLKP